jgi:hypothetical protein
MIRIFALIMAAFFLYWVLKGTLRRFLAPPPAERKRARAREESRGKPVTGNRRAQTIDYSKVKDADYRDLR